MEITGHHFNVYGLTCCVCDVMCMNCSNSLYATPFSTFSVTQLAHTRLYPQSFDIIDSVHLPEEYYYRTWLLYINYISKWVHFFCCSFVFLSSVLKDSKYRNSNYGICNAFILFSHALFSSIIISSYLYKSFFFRRFSLDHSIAIILHSAYETYISFLL